MKKLISVFLTVIFLSLPIFSADQIFTIDSDGSGFGGGVDYLAIDKVGSKFGEIGGIIDINTDRRSELSKKYGSTKYNPTATTGALKQRRGYVYNQADGDSYIITQSSNSLFASVGAGNLTTIISTLSATAGCDFTTANDKVYYTNGTDTPGSWNGSALVNYTVLNSTFYPSACKYIVNWKLRNWLAGDTTYKSRLFWSSAFVPSIDAGAYENFPAANFIDIGAGDGDTITGLQIVNGRLYVYFSKKIFEIVDLGNGNFSYRQLSEKIGCLYNTTLDILNGLPIFMSHRGVEQFDGSNFDLKSLAIDYYVKDLKQIKTGLSMLAQDTSADWGAGSGTNIDTTTYSGSVAIKSDVINSLYESQDSHNAGVSFGTVAVNQTFYTNYDIYLTTVSILGIRLGFTGQVGDLIVNISSANQVIIATVTTTASSITKGTSSDVYWIPFEFWLQDSITLLANNTYYIVAHTTYSYYGASGGYNWRENTSNPYSKGRNNESATYDYTFRIYGSTNPIYSSASYTTQSLNATGWGTWSIFSADETKPTDSSINYYAITSTSTYNLSTNAAFPVTSGNVINSAVGPYIKVISSFTRTDVSAIPMLNSFNIAYYGTTNDIPIGKVWQDRYYLAVNTITATTNNDTILVMQKNGDWTRYSNRAGAFYVYRDNLYYGDSQDTGFLYRMEVPNIYTDNGNNYKSYWTSKKISLNPIYKTNIKELWTLTDGTAGTLDLSYNFDDYDGTWQTQSITVPSANKTNVLKTHITPNCYSRYFQFEIGNSLGVDFRIKNIHLIHDDAPAIE